MEPLGVETAESEAIVEEEVWYSLRKYVVVATAVRNLEPTSVAEMGSYRDFQLSSYCWQVQVQVLATFHAVVQILETEQVVLACSIGQVHLVDERAA